MQLTGEAGCEVNPTMQPDQYYSESPDTKNGSMELEDSAPPPLFESLIWFVVVKLRKAAALMP